MSSDATRLIKKLNERINFVQILKYFDIEFAELSDRFRIICPFHDDHHPSLIIYTDHKKHDYDTFWCPVCNLTGDPFEFIRLMRKQKLGLKLSDKIDFQESFELLKKLANYKETKGDSKEDFYEKLEKKEEPEKEKDAGKTYLHICGMAVRDAVKQKRVTFDFANRIFKKMDQMMEGELDTKKAKVFYDRVVKKLKSN